MVQYSCKYCRFQSYKKTKLEIHLRGHTGERPFKCNIDGCSKAFFLKPHLQNHLRIHANEKPFICTNCKSQFRTKAQLSRHHRAIHDKSNFKYDCSFCDERFRLKSEARGHMQNVHKHFEFICNEGTFL